jgi:hypothetical protein
MYVEDLIGLEPRTKQLLIVRDKALLGDIVLGSTPPDIIATIVNADIAANTKSVKFIPIQLKTADYGPHNWFDGEFNVSVAKTSTAGVVAISEAATKVTIESGEGIIRIELTGTWVSGDKVTVTVTGKTILGYVVSNLVEVITLQ